MIRLYLALGVLAVIASGAAYLRFDAIQDERRAAELRQAEQVIKDRKKIDEALIDNRNSGSNFTERLCAAFPDRCSDMQ